MRATLDVAPSEPHDNFINRLDYLTPAEQQAETMAEKERYYSLYTNEVEEELYKGKKQLQLIIKSLLTKETFRRANEEREV